MRRPEQALQLQVATYLDLVLGGAAMWFHIPNAAKRGVVAGAMNKRLGVKAGIPDLCILDGGRALFIELKAEKGRVSPAQQDTIAAIQHARCVVGICRSLEDVAAFLGRHGIAVKGKFVPPCDLERMGAA